MLAGVELRKERRLSEVLTDSFNILFAFFRPLAIISIPVVVANVALSLVILAISQDLPTSEEIANDTAEFSTDDAIQLITWLSILFIVAIPLIFILQQLVAGAAVVFLDQVNQGNALPPAEALDQAQAKLGALIGATLRATVIILLLCITIIGIPFAIYRAVRWVFLAQVIMVEGISGPEVLARSAALVEGKWWNTCGRLIVVALVIGIPIGILQQALVAAAPGVVGTILSGSTGFISVPFGIISLTLMFFHLRARKVENAVIDPGPEPAP